MRISMDSRKLINIAKRTIEMHYRGSRLKTSGCPEYRLECIAMTGDGHNVEELKHEKYIIGVNAEDIAVVTGRYKIVIIRGDGRKTEASGCATVLVHEEKGREKAALLHISEAEKGVEHRLVDVRERVLSIPEADILYLESGHNRVFWHCSSEVIETMGTLKNAEQSFSDIFVRIHRGFLVNSRYVTKVDRCYAELANGETLQIPEKKYTEVKRKLMKERFA